MRGSLPKMCANPEQAAKGPKTSLEKMVSPKVELPAQLKSATAVTAMSHPYWGQMFLAEYPPLKTLLTPVETHYSLNDLNFLRKCLVAPQMNAFVWRRLATEYPQQLQQAIAQMFDLPDFDLSRDLDSILTKFNKYLEPDLPEIASVPIHLHELFQSAVMEVSKDKARPKSQPKKTGFGAKN
jgi:hypothetical protein